MSKTKILDSAGISYILQKIKSQIDLKANKTEIPKDISELNNDSGYITSYTEIDPTVPSWAKQSNKPTYTAEEVGAYTKKEVEDALEEVLESDIIAILSTINK